MWKSTGETLNSDYKLNVFVNAAGITPFFFTQYPNIVYPPSNTKYQLLICNLCLLGQLTEFNYLLVMANIILWPFSHDVATLQQGQYHFESLLVSVSPSHFCSPFFIHCLVVVKPTEQLSLMLSMLWKRY